MTSISDHTVRSILGLAACLGALACTTVPPNSTGIGGSAGNTTGAAGAPGSSGMTGGGAAGMNGAGGSAMGGMGAAGAPSPMAGAGGNPAAAGTAGAGTAGTGIAGSGMGGATNAGASAGGTTNAGASAGGTDAGGAGVGGGGASTGGVGGGGMGGTGGGGGGDFVLTAPWDSPDTCSPDAPDTCGNIPIAHRLDTIGGDNVMPLLSWPEGPEGTLSYVLVYHDLSFEQGGAPFVHWALWNIPVGTASVDGDTIPAGTDEGGLQDGAWTGSGACGNVYELIVYALNVDEYLPGGDRTALRDALEGDDAALVLARDTVRGQTQDPCN